MFEGLRTAKMALQDYNLKEVAERMAEMVIFDLEEEHGFKAHLVKHNPRKPKTWRIEPDEILSAEKQKEFERLKQELTDKYRAIEKSNMQHLRKNLG